MIRAEELLKKYATLDEKHKLQKKRWLLKRNLLVCNGTHQYTPQVVVSEMEITISNPVRQAIYQRLSGCTMNGFDLLPSCIYPAV